MRKIVAGLYMSLDGVIESPEKWSGPYFDDEMGQAVGAQMAASDTLLLGRRTYEEFAAFWPSRTDVDDPFAGYINGVPKLVVSTTLKSVDWQPATLISGDVVEELTRLKGQPGKNISITGSVTLVRSLLHARLIDELALMLLPVTVGTGNRLFVEGDQIALKLLDSRSFDSGVVFLIYGPVDA